MKLKNIKKVLVLAILAAVFPFLAKSQALKVPAASPTQTLKQAFGLGEITVEYSRPSAKGRIVYGDVVPFGKVWRTGANSSTKITFTDDVKIDGKDLKAGTYAIYTIPNKEIWDIMFYKDLTLGGNVADYKAENEVLRIQAKPILLGNKVETFTMNIANITAKTASLELDWENTKISIPVSVEIESRIMKAIETNVIKDSRPYYQAASYYYENNKDLKLAFEWVNKALETYPKAYWIMLLKAKIQLKLNDKKGAIASANQVILLATEDKDDNYIKQGEKIINEAK
jgi:hypothetical protein